MNRNFVGGGGQAKVLLSKCQETRLCTVTVKPNSKGEKEAGVPRSGITEETPSPRSAKEPFQNVLEGERGGERHETAPERDLGTG